ncbi:MAG: InlB B-repeat-containing protein [Nitrososphaerota archaeon]|jgi:uncharacterized repeat protein (TIGR02543 family)|nr:InlB B-repeat-containing protein [Nitrososphaerota archaeon]
MNTTKPLKKEMLTLIAICLLASSAFVMPTSATEQEAEPISIMPIFINADGADYIVTSDWMSIEGVDITLYDVLYTVIYDANGGSGSGLEVPLTESNLLYGSYHMVLSAEAANAGTKEGYAFMGWNTKADGSGLIGDVARNFIPDQDTFIADDIILYAQWSKILSVTPTAYVTQLNGNKNDLAISITEELDNGTTNTIQQAFDINKNAADTYTIGSYSVYVDTKGNTQIRACYLV